MISSFTRTRVCQDHGSELEHTHIAWLFRIRCRDMITEVSLCTTERI
jgi:hypothetical protein